MKTSLMVTVLVLFCAVPHAHAQFAQSRGPLVTAQALEKEVADDREIELRVQSALFKDKRLSGSALNVKASGGTVEISGRADSQSQADRAVQIARAVPGVRSVMNEIRVN